MTVVWTSRNHFVEPEARSVGWRHTLTRTASFSYTLALYLNPRLLYYPNDGLVVTGPLLLEPQRVTRLSLLFTVFWFFTWWLGFMAELSKIGLLEPKILP